MVQIKLKRKNEPHSTRVKGKGENKGVVGRHKFNVKGKSLHPFHEI